MSYSDPPSGRKDDLFIDAQGIKKAALIVRAVNHPLRQKILRIIDSEGPVPVTVLYRKLKLVQPVMSSHLAVLRRAGAVTTRREGRNVLYFINHERLEQLHRSVEGLLNGIA